LTPDSEQTTLTAKPPDAKPPTIPYPGTKGNIVIAVPSVPIDLPTGGVR